MAPHRIVIPDAESDADARLFRELFGRLARHDVELDIHVGQPSDEDEWARVIGDADGLILNWKLPDHALASAGRLRVITFLGTGASDHLNMELAAQRGILVGTVTGYADDAVAEHVFALLLALARSVPAHDAQLRQGHWQPVSGLQLRGLRLGLVGFGGIARRVAQIASGFGMETCAYNRSPFTHPSVRQVELDELLRTSDVVSLHLALTPQTEGFIGENEFASMRQTAVLINTARGALVDETALVDALRDGRIAGAGLDVFAVEPATTANPLLRSDRVVITPHIGYATEHAERELLSRGLEQTLLALADSTPNDA